jgi:2-dehydrotetronate isomerase
MFTLAANLSWLFQEWPFLDRFSAAADAGFQAVEFLFPYDHKPDLIAGRLSRHNLKLALFNLPPGDFAAGERGLAGLSGRRPDFRAAVQSAIDYARATGTGRLHAMAGIAAGEAAQATYKDSLKFACEAAAPFGIDILIEPINSGDMPGYLMNDFGWAERVISALGLPNLKLQFDIYHRQILQGDVTRGLDALMPVIGHIQIASVPLRQEPTTGELDDRHVLNTIAALGYSGFVGCEYRPAAGTVLGLEWMKRLG